MSPSLFQVHYTNPLEALTGWHNGMPPMSLFQVHYTNPPEALTGWHNGMPPMSLFLCSLKEAAFISKGPDGSGAVMRMGGAAQVCYRSKNELGCLSILIQALAFWPREGVWKGWQVAGPGRINTHQDTGLKAA